MRPDADLQKQVMQELACDPHVDETALGVSVRHGIVTVNGIVHSAAAKALAEAAVHRVPGVHDVANEIEVALNPTNPTDSEIAEAVRNALASSALVRQEQIQSTVAGHGHVTLRGTVSTLRERSAAEAAVRGLAGVALVTNLIVVDAPAASPAELRSSIEHALERHLARDLDRIAIEIHGDTVVLTGTIGSPAERRAVVGAVKGAPGIKHVDDRLCIAPDAGSKPAAT